MGQKKGIFFFDDRDMYEVKPSRGPFFLFVGSKVGVGERGGACDDLCGQKDVSSQIKKKKRKKKKV